MNYRITGTGSCIPDITKKNSDFLENKFLDTDGGKLVFKVSSDCATPVDVTIQFDATFTRCTTDNCVGDNYHVSPSWD